MLSNVRKVEDPEEQRKLEEELNMLSSDSVVPLRYIVANNKEKGDVSRGRSLFRDKVWVGNFSLQNTILNAPSHMKSPSSERVVPLFVKGIIQEWCRICRKSS